MNIKDIQFLLKRRNSEDTYHPAKFIVIVEELGYLAKAINKYKETPNVDTRETMESEFAVVAIMLGQFANWFDLDLEEAIEQYWPKFLEFQKNHGVQFGEGKFN